MWRDIPLIYSDLYPEDKLMEVAHAWEFMVKAGGLRGGSFVFTKLSLMNFTADTLKESHASTNMVFIW